MEAAGELEVKLRQMRFHTFLYVLDPAAARRELIAEDERGFEDALEVARRSAVRPDEQRLVASIAEEYARYRSGLDGAAESPPAPLGRQEYLAWADAHPVRPLLDRCQELMRVNRAAMEETARESQRVSDRAGIAMTALAVLGPLGGLVAGFGIARGLSRSIAQLRVRVEDVRAELDQDVGTVRVLADGGLGGLDDELGRVLARVREVVEQAQQRERETLRAEQLAAVGQLAAGVAHEVRNPLMSMKLLIEAALAGGELTAEDLRVIHGEIGRLEQAVSGLLDFARPTPPRREAADLRDVVGAAVDLVRGRAALQKVRIDVDMPNGPLEASVDAAQLKGVAVNLLLNALDAMPGGGRVDVVLAGTGAGEVSLSVGDTGRGIPAAILPRLFEPFASTKDTGTGLGLHVSRRIVARPRGGNPGRERLGGRGPVHDSDSGGCHPCPRCWSSMTSRPSGTRSAGRSPRTGSRS